MKPFRIWLFALGICLWTSSCVIPLQSKGPPTGQDDTLVYFLVDVTDMPGDFYKAVFHSVDKSFSVGTAFDGERWPKNPHIVLIYVNLPNTMNTYFSELRDLRTGFLTNAQFDTYMMTPQESPVRVAKTTVKAGIRYGGAFKFKFIDNGPLKSDKFQLGPCPNCPSEKQALEQLVVIGDKGGELLAENNYLAKVKARLASLNQK